MNIAFIIPCFNEEKTLEETSRTLCAKFDRLLSSGLITSSSKLVFIDDGSTDFTWDLLKAFAEKDDRIKAIKLATNKGHQNALLAGLLSTYSNHDATISLDADLQDDIEVIDEMIREFSRGKEIVYGVRNDRDSDSFFKRLFAQSFYKLMSLFGAKTIYNHADFRLASKKAISHLNDFNEVNLYLRGIFPQIGLDYSYVHYSRKNRLSGESKYTIKKMVSFAINGLTSFSIAPLRIATLLGILSLSLTIVLTVWAFYSKATGNVIKGWSSTVLSIYFLGSIQLICIGILGEYIGKIYMEVKKRPRYIIEEEIL